MVAGAASAAVVVDLAVGVAATVTVTGTVVVAAGGGVGGGRVAPPRGARAGVGAAAGAVCPRVGSGGGGRVGAVRRLSRLVPAVDLSFACGSSGAWRMGSAEKGGGGCWCGGSGAAAATDGGGGDGDDGGDGGDAGDAGCGGDDGDGGGSCTSHLALAAAILILPPTGQARRPRLSSTQAVGRHRCGVHSSVLRVGVDFLRHLTDVRVLTKPVRQYDTSIANAKQGDGAESVAAQPQLLRR